MTKKIIVVIPKSLYEKMLEVVAKEREKGEIMTISDLCRKGIKMAIKELEKKE